MPPIERLLQRDGAITLAGLAALWVLTWWYLVSGAGLGMSAWDMTLLALWPQQHFAAPMPAMPGMELGTWVDAWDGARWGMMIAMWWAMMIAMMTPSAAPTILLYARVRRHGPAQSRQHGTTPPTTVFVAGYFLVWLVFSVVATALHQALEAAGVVSAITMGSRLRWLSGATLVAAGVYQLSPLKHACLSHCRSPAQFLSRHWRAGAIGALRLGVVHGAYCVGCCWMLMALLFAGGVMNLAWIAALSALVLAEKVLPAGRWVSRCAGVLLIAWGAMMLVPVWLDQPRA